MWWRITYNATESISQSICQPQRHIHSLKMPNLDTQESSNSIYLDDVDVLKTKQAKLEIPDARGK